MRLLYVYTEHRGGGGTENSIRATMEIFSQHGHVVDEFKRCSDDLPEGLKGRFMAGISAFHAPESLRAFCKVLDFFRPDAIHTYDLFPLISPDVLAECTKRRIPVVMSCVHYRLTCPAATHFHQGKVCTRCLGGNEHQAVLHNCRENVAESVTVALYNRQTRQRRSFLDHVSRFIAPSEFTREWMSQNAGIPLDRITVVIPAVDLPARMSDPAEGTYVGFAGRFTPEKGIDVLLAAGEECGVPTRLCRNQKFRNHKQTGTAEIVTTHSREDLHAFYAGARMMVVPSIWFETFGMVPAESMAHGIPVIASRIGALSELIEDGKDGLLFEPGNVQDLVSKIRELWDNPMLCRRLGSAARHKVMAWSQERFYNTMLELYDEVIEGAATSRRRSLVNA